MPTVEDEIVQRATQKVGVVLRDKWRLDRLLGVGGMAAVFAATHRNGKRAAVKVLHPEAALAPSVKSRFLQEGYLANKVEHPGAVSILDDDIDEDGTVFLVMELLEGETLEARLDRTDGKVEVGELLQIADQVLDCLSAAHDKSIVHRDLKPGNLFITTSGAVKILDFGIARLTVGRKGGHTTGAQTLGTPGFMPPEQARGHWDQVDAKSDLWAVGAVLFAAITGRFVHEAPTVNEQLLAAMTVPATPLSEAAPSAAPELGALVDRALAFQKADRWPDAQSMRDAVRAAYETLTGRPMAEAPKLSARPPKPRSIDPSAPTIDAVELATGVLPATTARPVAARGGAQERRASPARVLIPIALVGMAVGGFVVWSAPNASETEAAPRAASPVAAPEPTPESTSPLPPAEPAETETEAPPPSALSASAEASAEPMPATPKMDRPSAAGTAVKRTAARAAASPKTVRSTPKASSASEKPSGGTAEESIDLFTRRK